MKKRINHSFILVTLLFIMFISGCSSNKEVANEATEEIKETIQESNPSLTTIDFFSALSDSCVTFQGSDGHAKAKLDYSIECNDVFYDDGEIKIHMAKNSNYDLIFMIHRGTHTICSLEIQMNKSSDLSNGDIIELSLEKLDLLKENGIVPKNETMQIEVSGLPLLVKTGNEITREMLKNHLINSEAFYYSCDANDVDIDIISAVFFKIPSEPGYEEETIICVDYKVLAKTEKETYDQTILSMMYHPAIKDNELYIDRDDRELAEKMYGPFEDEFKEVGVDIKINDYLHLLKVMQSSDMQKLFDAGLEDSDYVEYVLYCFVNDSTYIISR